MDKTHFKFEYFLKNRRNFIIEVSEKEYIFYLIQQDVQFHQ